MPRRGSRSVPEEHRTMRREKRPAVEVQDTLSVQAGSSTHTSIDASFSPSDGRNSSKIHQLEASTDPTIASTTDVDRSLSAAATNRAGRRPSNSSLDPQTLLEQALVAVKQAEECNDEMVSVQRKATEMKALVDLLLATNKNRVEALDKVLQVKDEFFERVQLIGNELKELWHRRSVDLDHLDQLASLRTEAAALDQRLTTVCTTLESARTKAIKAYAQLNERMSSFCPELQTLQDSLRTTLEGVQQTVADVSTILDLDRSFEEVTRHHARLEAVLQQNGERLTVREATVQRMRDETVDLQKATRHLFRRTSSLRKDGGRMARRLESIQRTFRRAEMATRMEERSGDLRKEFTQQLDSYQTRFHNEMSAHEEKLNRQAAVIEDLTAYVNLLEEKVQELGSRRSFFALAPKVLQGGAGFRTTHLDMSDRTEFSVGELNESEHAKCTVM
ncbi:hypothetical protein GMRT_10728 [Giardia muris]|uniref:Uncharacterized protein n=1 Tax=Giardia muris TaxID=5742 RepID=A0A4Z1SSW9_GIAMU|nr:hypothetical protein GMRT_10728 [Giardia muris]|eukprot:TNJ28974.1 hypothetical protein GMRT_10728 [Giardia muris]